ncbi:MAG: dienelactone hydrolase family protein [Planctomycetales bacterium]|nr:dienelactone hydrolase family protein [Planctomycetales bacterium]
MIIRHVRAFILGACICGLTIAADPSEFVDFSTPDLPGRLYVPPEAADSERPVILFLHGAGETGSNNRAQINSNVDNLFAAAKERGAFLYAPQAKTVVGGIFNWNDTDRTNEVMLKLDEILAGYNTDPNRVYVTGLSMGGGGTWNLLSRYSDRFAAAVPIAGVRTGDDFEPANLLTTPIWAFHARNDSVISANFSRRVVNSVLQVAGDPELEFPSFRDRESVFEFASDSPHLRYTEYPTGGHGIWGTVYGTAEVQDWMFAQSVPEPSCSALTLALFVALVVAKRLV